jgi:hypothetical protein
MSIVYSSFAFFAEIRLIDESDESLFKRSKSESTLFDEMVGIN